MAEYIVHYFSEFFTDDESLAWRHWSSNYKLEHGTYTSEEAKESRRKMNLKRGWMTKDPEVLRLLDGGIDQFKIRTAERILMDHESEIFLSRCPKCSALTRTPKSKQCYKCFHSWH